jgi:acyl-CoA thioesterase I
MPMPSRVNAFSRRGLLALAAFALLLAAARAQDAPPDGARTVVFFGDSLTAGYGLQDPSTQSYPALIQARIDAAHLRWRVVNAGVSGETSAGGLRRVDWVLRQPVDVFVLELGANDGLRGTSPEVTRANLQAIVDRVRAKDPSARILLAGMRMPSSMSQEYSDTFSALFPALASRDGLILIPFLLEGVAGRADLNQGDEMHPNAAGAVIVADVVWKYLEPVLKNHG